MNWRTQNPTFQVLYSVMPHNNCPPPLQIRAFTSDSYKAIKKKEHKKSDLREQNKAEQWSSARKKEDTGTFASAVAMQEVTRMDSGPYDVVSATHSGGSKTEPLVIQDGGRVQGDNKLQYRLCWLGAAPISPPQDPSSSHIQCPAAPASLIMSPTTVSSEVCTGAEQEWELCCSGIPCTASLDDVHMITTNGDDAGTFNQQSHTQTQNNAELTAESPLYHKPANSSTKGCSKLCEQLIKSHDAISCGPVSLKPSSVPVVTAATGLEWLSSTHAADAALAEVLPDRPSHTIGVARTIRSHTHEARSERASSIDCKSTSQSAWTSSQDEQLLHLRDTAQLSWRNIVNYFPEVALDAVKSRYKHLTRSRMTHGTLTDNPKPRVQMRKRSSYLASSTPQRAAKKCRASTRTESQKQSFKILSDRHATPHYGHVNKWANPTRYIASLGAVTQEVAAQRTSRCGRPTRHPFRHRPSEGYV